MKFLVVGAGVAGLSFAAFLRKHSIFPTVIEKEPELHHLGYVIGIWQNGVNTLGKLGLAEPIRKASKVIEKHKVLLASGEELHSHSYDDLNKKYGDLIELEREIFYDLLLQANKQTDVRFSTSISSLEQDEHGVQVTFSDGSEETYDFVVGADGVHSQVRDIIFPGLEEKKPEWVAWFFWVPEKTARIDHFTSMLGKQAYFGVYPTRDENRALCTMITIPTKVPEEGTEAQKIRNLFSDMGGMVPKILSKLPPEEEIRRSLHHNIEAPGYFKGRVALIGDALRTTNPVLGMGSSMAIEDAYVLAEELAKARSEEALPLFEKRRRKKFKKVATVSYEFSKIIALPYIFSPVRDLLFKRFYKEFFVTQLEPIIAEPP